MNTKELVDVVAGRITHLPKRELEAVIKEMFEAMTRNLKRSDHIEIRGFGTFTPQFHEGRIHTTPQGDRVKSSAAWRVGFKPSRLLLDRL